ncbi:MAG: PASTA domain-containing protein [Planctomycetota bacterium]
MNVLRRSVRVPSLLGQMADDARAAIEQLGLRAEVSEVDDDAGAPGTVVAQDPGSNSEVVPGARVRLTVARPGGDVVPPALTAQVPNLVGKALGDAQAAAADAGFDLDIVFVDASGTPNRVIAQHVPAGTSVELGTVIAVDVSKAPPAPTVTVPPVEVSRASTRWRPCSPAACAPGSRSSCCPHLRWTASLVSSRPLVRRWRRTPRCCCACRRRPRCPA